MSETRKTTKRLAKARERESVRPRKSAAPPAEKRGDALRERREVSTRALPVPETAEDVVGLQSSSAPTLRLRVADLEAALRAEKAERDAEAAVMGEMLARVASAEAKVKAAEAATEAADARARLAEERARDLEDRTRMMADRVRDLEAESLRLKSVRPPPPGDRSSEAEARLEALEALCADAASLFEELERREAAVAEFRSQALRDARAALLRSIGRDDAAARRPPPPLPGTPGVLDVSDLAETYESMPPRGES